MQWSRLETVCLMIGVVLLILVLDWLFKYYQLVPS